ncbi:MAG: hypothetical protein M1814_001476 [Vezdaea aestivalis]|nr:MAG: hypothetical protein M1814_001476 [Vezdaea aestivalis]
MTQPQHPLTYFPAPFYDYSHTYNNWVPLFISELHALSAPPAPHFDTERRPTFFYLNHPIRYIKLVGIVISHDIYARKFGAAIGEGAGKLDEELGRTGGGRHVVTLDDGSGHTVEITGDIKHFENLRRGDVESGRVWKVKGSMAEFRSVRNVQVETITVFDEGSETLKEVQFWQEMVKFRKQFMSEPWAVTDEMREEVEKQRQLHIKAERREKDSSLLVEQKQISKRASPKTKPRKTQRRSTEERCKLREEKSRARRRVIANADKSQAILIS